MYAYAPQACLVLSEVREGVRCPGTAATDGREPLYGCWESLGLLQEQHVLLTTVPSL